MAIFAKPSGINKIWASSGTKVAPTDAKIAQGWVVEKPPYQIDNYLNFKRDSILAHINQFGIVVWDSETEYQAGKSYVQDPTTGVLYRCKVTHTNQPTSATVYWEVAFTPKGEGYTKTESDDLFAKKSSNLSDLANTTTARQNLGAAPTASPTFTGSPTAPTAAYESNNTQVATTAFVMYHGVPAGGVAAFALATAPNGWLVADGSAVSRTTYARLFAAMGTLFGAGNGSTTFNLPDLRGEFIRGLDNGRGIDSGRTLGSAQSYAIQSHVHTASTDTAANHTHTGSATTSGAHSHTASSGNAGWHEHTVTIATAGVHAHTAWTDSQGEHFHNVAEGSVIPSAGGTLTSGDDYTANIGHYQATSWGGAHVHNVGIGNAGDHSHTATVAAAPDHAHTVTINSGGAHIHALSVDAGGSHSHTVTVNATGGTETRPRNIALLYCIKY